MGNYRSRRPGFLQGWQLNVADMMFRGFTEEEIAKEIWGVEKGDEKGMRNAKSRLRNLRSNEKFAEYYRSLITEWSVHHVGKALNTIAKQMDDPSPWMANKAANDVLLQSKSFITGVDDNTVLVKVEGMPEIGTPEE